MRVCLCVAESHGGPSKVMIGVSQSCMRRCSVAFGVLASIYAIPVGWTLCRNWISLLMCLRVCSWWWIIGCVDLDLGMFGRLAITMSIPSGKLFRIPSSVIQFVSIGSEVSHSCGTVMGSWLGY